MLLTGRWKCVGPEVNTKVGREHEALCDIISAILRTSFGGLSLGFHQAWQFLFYLKRVSLLLFMTHHTCLTFHIFVLGVINPVKVAAVYVCFTECALHSQVPYCCDFCCKWSVQLRFMLKYHLIFLCQVTCVYITRSTCKPSNATPCFDVATCRLVAVWARHRKAVFYVHGAWLVGQNITA